MNLNCQIFNLMLIIETLSNTIEYSLGKHIYNKNLELRVTEI